MWVAPRARGLALENLVYVKGLLLAIYGSTMSAAAGRSITEGFD
jgi:hypothetical protein